MSKIIIMLALCALSSLSHAATLEIPPPHTTLSGIGVVSGWKCDAGELTIRFNNGPPIPLAYRNERADTLSVCGDTDNGFVSIMNWGNLGDGQHLAVVYDDGIEFAHSLFWVVTTGEPFLRGASGECLVDNFPAPGEQGRFTWNQATQHMELVEVQNAPREPEVVHGECGSQRDSCSAGTWRDIGDTTTHERWQCLGQDGGQTATCEVQKQSSSQMPFMGQWTMEGYITSGCGTANGRGTWEVNTLGDLSGQFQFDRDLRNIHGTIRRNVVRTLSGTISSIGIVNGLFRYERRILGSFTGRLQERGGSGTWDNTLGCQGKWSARRR